MNPEQVQSAIRTAILAGPGLAILIKWGLTQDQVNTLVPIIATLVYGGGSWIVGWWGNRAHSAAAITAAVNSSSAPGVKVVPIDSTPTPPVNLDASGTVVPVGAGSKS